MTIIIALPVPLAKTSAAPPFKALKFLRAEWRAAFSNEFLLGGMAQHRGQSVVK
jgi:hypothetical protein